MKFEKRHVRLLTSHIDRHSSSRTLTSYITQMLTRGNTVQTRATSTLHQTRFSRETLTTRMSGPVRRSWISMWRIHQRRLSCVSLCSPITSSVRGRDRVCPLGRVIMTGDRHCINGSYLVRGPKLYSSTISPSHDRLSLVLIHDLTTRRRLSSNHHFVGVVEILHSAGAQPTSHTTHRLLSSL